MLTFRPSAGAEPEQQIFPSALSLSLSLLTDLLRGSGPGEEVASVVPVDGDVENLGLGVELLLGPVTVVNVLHSQEMSVREL